MINNGRDGDIVEYLVWTDTQKSRDVGNHIFNGRQRLRDSETSQSRVGMQIGLTDVSCCQEIWNIVAIVTVV